MVVLFVAWYVLFSACCLLCDQCVVMRVACCLSFDDVCVLFVVCRVVCCLMSVGCTVMSGVCCVCWLLFLLLPAVRCSLFFAFC